MEANPIIISNEYRSGFRLTVKQSNGKVSATWLEVSDHNEKLATTMANLSNLLESLGLKQDINLIAKPVSSEVELKPKVPNYRYVCQVCHSDIPAFEDQPEYQKLFCGKCQRWQVFGKIIKKREE